MKLDRNDYPTDKAFFDAMVDGELEWMRKERWKAPFGTDIPHRWTLIGPQWQCAHIPHTIASFAGEGAKERTTAKLAYLAKVTSAKGLMLASDARLLSGEDFNYHFKLDPPRGIDDDAYWDKYREIMRRHGGSIANLPRHLWSEGLIIVLKTPTKTYTRRTTYTRGSGKRVMFVPSPVTPEMQFQANIVPDYWTIPDDDPNLKRAELLAVTLLTEILERKTDVTEA